jgi:hypothetical protein
MSALGQKQSFDARCGSRSKYLLAFKGPDSQDGCRNFSPKTRKILVKIPFYALVLDRTIQMHRIAMHLNAKPAPATA